MDDDIATRPAVELAEAIRAKQISSTELLELYLDRIERLDGEVHSVVTFAAERARAEAAAADAAVARGDVDATSRPLHGLPITVKDAIETEGIRSTGGAVELAEHVPAADAPAVAKLRAAGAVVFGKTNLPRWSGDLQSYNELFGTTRNPWATDLIPGGSSGGAAAAVACGFTAFETGTDIGGSVRMPSHFCGVYGLKPSFGVVPQRGYLDHVGGGTTDADINVFGPIARSADDLALLLGVLAGPPPEQEVAWRVELPAPRWSELRDLRIGTWLDDPACRIARGYHDVLRTTADRLADAGAKVEEAHPPVAFEEQLGVFLGMIGGAVSVSMPPEEGEVIGGSHHGWLALERQRAALRRVWAEWFESYDVLLCPVTPTPAFPHDQEGTIFTRTMTVDGETRPYVDNVSWTGLIGVVGLPSAVVPVGPTADGLPVGVQCVAAYGRDLEAVRAAGLIGEVTGGYRSPPGFA